jgi:hypothetical protein
MKLCALATVALFVVLYAVWPERSGSALDAEMLRQSFSTAAAVRSVTHGPCAEKLQGVLRHSHGPPNGVVDLNGCGLGEGTRLEAVQETLFAMPHDWRRSVRTLDLGGNGLTGLPFGFFFRIGLLQPLFPALTTLFASGNRFTAVPPVIKRLHLTRLGLKDNRLTLVDAAAFPSGLVHLILTENRIRTAVGFGLLTHLRKLMLSGNQLVSPCSFVHGGSASVPSTASNVFRGPAMPSLELLRIARNNITALTPADVACFAPTGGAFPALRWMSLAGNPAVAMRADAADAPPLPDLSRAVDCEGAPVLGSGASGIVKRCLLRLRAEDAEALKAAGNSSSPTVIEHRAAVDAPALPVAVKFFKAVSSDGSAADELAVLRSVPTHPHLLRPLGRIPAGAEHPNGAAVYAVMGRASPLGKAPTIETVTQDRFSEAAAGSLTMAEAVKLLARVAEAMAALHTAGVAHGDLYAHNAFRSPITTVPVCGPAKESAECAAKRDAAAIREWVEAAMGSGTHDDARPWVSDFGASFVFQGVPVEARTAAVGADATYRAAKDWPAFVQALEVRSFAVFVDDVVRVLVRAKHDGASVKMRGGLMDLAAECGGVLSSSPSVRAARQEQVLTKFKDVALRLRLFADA